MFYGRKPRLLIDLIFPAQVQFQVELEPEELMLEKERAMKKVFEFVALAREDSILRQKFFHDRNLRGKEFNLLDRVYLKNDKPRVVVSKKLKFTFDGVYTIVVMFESRSEDETTKLYKIKPEGRGLSKTGNGAKLRKATGPICVEKAKRARSDVSRHVDEAIERAVNPEMDQSGT